MKKIIFKIIFLVSFFILSSITKAFAEGTPQLSPNANTITAVLVAPDLSSGSFLNCLEDNRIYFRVGTNFTTESLYFGFDFRTYGIGSPLRADNVYYRIRRPNGSIAVNTTLWNPSTASNGSINSYTQAVAGPNIGGVTTGYAPLVFNPDTFGEHWIEFFRSTDGGATAFVLGTGSRAVAPLFDLTIANNSGAFTKFPGRVHCDKWGLLATTPTYGNRFDANSKPDLFVYTEDLVVLRLTFQDGFEPVAYDLAVNRYGVTNVGPFAATRRSVNAVAAPPLPDGFKLFFNKPDPVYYPIASVPALPTFLNPSITGCGPYNIRINISDPGDVRLFFNLNGVPGFQPNTTDRILEVNDLPAGNNSITWNGLDGLGGVVPDGGSVEMILSYLKGRFNVPLYDAEINKGGINVAIVEPIQVPNTIMYWDDTLLVGVGTVCITNTTDSQNNITSPGFNNSIIGTTSPAHNWNGDGNPTQLPIAPSVGSSETDGLVCNDFGNVRLINTWGYGIKSAAVTATVFKGCSDLRVVKTFAPNPNYVGGQITFTITASNISGSNNSNVVVTDAVPDGYTISTITPPTATIGTYTGNTWTIGNLNVGQTATLTIVATINLNQTQGYTNTAIVDGDNEEANPIDNTSTVTPTPIAPPTVTIGNAQILEGNNLSFPITLSNASGTAITLTFGYTNISTVNGDYDISPITITIPAGSTTGTLTVLTNEDSIDELDETFTVFITGSTGIVGDTTDTAIGTILDDDNPPTFSISNETIIEGNIVGNTGTFEVTLSNPSYLPTTLTITSTDGTANGTDFVPVSTTVTIPAGEITGTFTATTVPDLTAEVSENFTVNGNVTSLNTSNSSASGFGTITDDDANPTFAISNVTVIEGTTAVFTVSLSNASAFPITIAITSTNGTAGATDFNSINTSVTIPAGSLSTTVSVTTLGDLINELTETYTLNGTTPPGNTLNTSATGTGTITDDDLTPVVSIGNVTVTEGVNPTADFTVSLSVASYLPTTIVVTTTNGTAGATDFNSVNTTVIIPAGQLSVPVVVTILDDSTFEPSENYFINGNVTSTNTSNTNPTATGTILDNDLAPTVNISNQNIIEGNTGIFTVTLSNPSSTDTVINISTLNGTAVAGTDFTSVVTTVTILAGQLTATIPVNTIEDTTYEVDETFSVSGTVTSGNTTNINLVGIGTINDDDAIPAYSISNVSVTEGNIATFTVALTNPSFLPTVITISTANITTLDGDFTPVTTTITIPAGQTTVTVDVATFQDQTDEPTETFTLNGSLSSGVTTNTTAFGTGTIIDNDDAPTISISDITVNEGEVALFTVSLTNPSSVATIVNISSANGTAVGTDFTPVTTTITIPAGATSITIAITTLDDTTQEPTENYTLNGTVTTANTINPNATGLGTILDDDLVPTVSISSITIVEGSIGTFVVSLSNPSSLATVITITTANGSADGTDFTPVLTTITIPAGTTSVNVPVTTLNDNKYEITENFTLNGNVTTTNTANNNPSGTGTITDNDIVPSITISDETVDEGDLATFTVALSNPSYLPTIVTITSANGTANATDFNPVATTVTIPAGQLSVTVPVTTIEDITNEPIENYTLNGNVTSGNTSNINPFGTGTITDDDNAPTFTISSPIAIEGNPLNFVVAISAPSSEDTVITITSASGTATSPEDFTDVSISVTIPAGQTSVSVPVTTIQDLMDEPSENLSLNGTVTSGTVFNTTASGIGTITDNDPIPTITINDVTVVESGIATFTISLSNPSSVPTIINLSTAPITATTILDYTAVFTSVTIAAGTTSITFPVTTLEDLIDEPSETYNLNGTVTSANTANTTPQGLGTITDNDPTPTFTISNETVTEGATATFTVSLSNPSSVDTVINIVTTPVSALSGDDFTPVTTTITIPAGQTSVAVPVTTLEDIIDEPSETFTLNGTVTSGTIANATASGTGTITDNDIVPSITISDETVDEGDLATFTVALSNPSYLPTIVTITSANGTANATDFNPVATTVTIPAGQLSVTVPVTTLEDITNEPLENYTLNGNVTSGNTSNINPFGTGTITDDDNAPTFTISSPIAIEGNPLNFVVAISAPSSEDTVITITSASGTATSPEDFTDVSISVTIPAGQTSVSVPVTTIQDLMDEPSENLSLNGTVTSGTVFNTTASGIGTITDNDPIPTITINDVTVVESGIATFTISLSNPSSVPTIINLSTAPITATTILDYTAVFTSVTIAAGTTSITFPVTTLEDLIDEPSETYNLNGTVTSANTANTTPQGLGTITDNDPTPTFTISNETVTEGATATFTVSLSNPSSVDTVINIVTTPVSALSGDDFTPVTTTITIPAGQTSVAVPVTTLEDIIDEPSETFTLNGTVTSGTIANATASGTGTITDNDIVPSITISDETVDEGDLATFTVALSNPSYLPTIVTITSANGTANATDFNPVATTVTIPAGQLSVTVPVTTLEDITNEPLENYTLNGNVTSGNTSNINPFGTGTITDDDNAPTFTISSPTAIEGNPLNFVVAISAPSSVDTVITITSALGTATSPEDFTAVSISVTIPAGQTSVTVPVTTIQDLMDEPSENLSLNGTVTSGTVFNTTASGIGTITDNDPIPTITINDVTVVESGIATFTISLSNPSSVPTIINLSTAPITATTILDYTAVFTSVTIAAGTTSITFPVTTLEDLIDEPSETYNLNGTVTSANTANTTPQGLGRITDNDPTPTFTISNETVTEGATATFTVSLSNPSSVDTVINIVTTPVSALSGDDFTPVTTTITIPAGQTSVAVPVTTLEDIIDEPSETFTLNGTVTSGTIANATASGTGTITDNDPTPTVTIDSPSVNEGLPEVFTISLSNPSSVPTTILVSTALSLAPDAASLTDYTTVTSFLVTIPAGQTSITTTVLTTQDTIDEANEIFVLNGLITSGNTINTDAFGIGTILDEDGAPTFSISNTSTVEGGILNFVVALTNASSTPTVITVTTNPGTASALDYTPIVLTVTIPAGETTVNVQVQTTQDIIDEPSENLTLNGALVSGPIGINTSAFGTGVIIDEDPTPIITIDSPTTIEESNEVFTISLSNPSSEDTVIILSTSPNTASILDYTTFTSVTVTIPAGTTSITFDVPTTLDLLDENDETFVLSGVVTSGNTANTTPSGIGTITDNDPTPTFTISNETVTEGATATFTVSLSNPSSVDTVINMVTTPVSALSGDDFTPVTTTITIPAGQTSVTVPVTTLEDIIDEPSETFTLNGTVTSGTIANATASGTGTITDNDPTPTVTIDSPSVNEGLPEVFTISLSNPSSVPTTILVSTALSLAPDAASLTDYTTVTSFLVTIPAGQTSITTTVLTTQDSIDELNEIFVLNGLITSGNTINTDAFGIGTILDEDGAPTFSISNTSTVEGGILNFVVALTNASSTPTVITVTTNPGTASTLDYTPIVLTVTIPAGETTVNVQVQTTQDIIDEPSENLTLNGALVSGPIGINTSAFGTGVIIDEDPKPIITIDSPTTIEESNEVFTISLSNPSSEDTVIILSTSPNTASILDYTTFSSVTVTIPAGTTSITFDVPTTLDLLDENDETFVLSGVVTSGNTANSTPSGIGTITDNDPTPTFTISNETVTEGATATFTVTLSSPSSFSTVINIITTNNSAIAGLDYTPVTTTITIPAGQTIALLPVGTIGDNVYEPTETFTVNGNATSGNTTNTNAEGIGTITDNDPIPTFTISSIDIPEGSIGTFTITLSNPTSTPTDIDIVTTNGTAGSDDYNSVTTTITIPAGDTIATLPVITLTDAISEGSETFLVNGSSTTTNNPTAQGIGTIIDGSGEPIVTINNSSITEGGLLVFTASLNIVSTTDVVLTVLTTPVTASNEDFIPISVPVTITILAGQLTGSTLIDIQTIQDEIDEPTETFTLNGTVTSGNTANTNPFGIGTIIDNDPLPTVIINNPSIAEGGQLVFTATLSNPSSTDVVLTVITNPGSASNSDFLPITNPVTITIPAGQLTGITPIIINTIPDNINELTETFTLNGTVISNNTSNSDPIGIGEITDNTLSPTITINSPIVTEGGILVFTASLSNPSSTDVVVTVVTSIGSAISTDFEEIINPITITIPAGQLTGSTNVTIQSTIDSINEPDETFTLNGTVISGNTSNTDPTGIGTILDNDPLPIVTITGNTVLESTDTLPTSVTFTATLSNPSYLDTIITVLTSPGTASNLDFTPITVPITITILAGQTTGSTTVLVPTFNDTIDELEEQFTLDGTITSGNTLNTSAIGTGTITDTDGIPEVTITGTTVFEGQNVVFTATLSNPSAIATVITVLTAPGTASNTDFVQLSNPVTITIPAGALTGTTTVEVITEVDDIDELTETFTLNGTVTSGNTSNTNPIGIGTILDNSVTPTITLNNPSVIEGDILVFVATLSNPSSTPITISVITTPNTASNSDFTPITNSVTITIPAGALTGSTTVPVQSTPDSISESAETFFLDGTVISGTTTNSTAQGIGTITDPSGSLPIVTLTGTSVTEGGNVVFTASINVPSSTPIIITVETASNTANQPLDYNPTLTPIIIIIPAGSLTGSATLQVVTLVDSISELTETFFLNGTISSGNTSNTTAQGIGTILESLLLPTISISNSTVTEGDTLVFTATLSNESSTDVVLTVTTTPGSASNLDFTPTTGTIIIPAGSLTGNTTIFVPSIIDAISEGIETFTLDGTVTSGNTLNINPVGIGTIGESLPLPTVIINNPTVSEGDVLLFTATLSNASATPVIITFVTTPGTASNLDFTTTIGTITIPAGSLTGSTSITVPSTEDLISENSENFTLNGTVTTGNTATPTPFGTGTITDDDATLIATDDPFSVSCTTSGIIGNILTNDSVNGNPATTSNIVLTITSAPIANIQIDNQGNVVVFSGIAFGTYTITYKICEATNLFNCKDAIVTIVVADTTPPTWLTNPLPTDIPVSCDAIPVAPILLATDSCGSASVVNNPDTVVAGTCAGNYVITRTWTATDLSGNTTLYTQTITVTDTTAPVFNGTLPADTTVDCATIPLAPIITATDNCSLIPLNAVLTETITVALPTECPKKSTIRREWNVSDVCGNAAVAHVQIITVQDSTAPVIDPTFPLTLTATCDAIPAVVQPNITDNCTTIGNGLVITPLVDVSSPIQPNGTYTITRTWEATDGCNPKTFTQEVTVTIPNYILQAPQLYANCNIDNSLKFELLTEIQKTYPSIFTNGTFNDIDELGASFDAANGTFEPYNVAIGDYKIEYTNNDPLCPSIVIFEIRVDDDCTVENCQTLEVHNAVTPNGDMDNDTLVFDGISTECYKNNSLEIYNRWGVLIYEKENYDNLNDPFTGISDGRSTLNKGTLLPTGTYFYFIKFKSTIGDINPQSGYIYLTRD